MTNEELDITEEKRSNLTKLADLLERVVPPPEFDMSSFVDSELERGIPAYSYPIYATAEVYAHCGTVACACGHGPMAGMPGLEGEDWTGYSERVFHLSPFQPEWDFLFSGQWADIDNTPKGAAARIRRLLDKGLPTFGKRNQKSFETVFEHLTDLICDADWDNPSPTADGKVERLKTKMLASYAEYLVG